MNNFTQGGDPYEKLKIGSHRPVKSGVQLLGTMPNGISVYHDRYMKSDDILIGRQGNTPDCFIVGNQWNTMDEFQKIFEKYNKILT